MDKKVDLYWSIRSSYSYLALDRIIEIKKKYQINLKTNLILPLAVRHKNYFINLPKNRKNYGQLDNKRIADYYGIPFSWPDPDPVKFLDGVPVDDQSLAFNFSRLGVLADIKDKGFEYIEGLSRIIWNGNTKGWNNKINIEKMLGDIGLDYKSMQEEVDLNPGTYDKILEENAKKLEESGHWGVPTLVVENEPFFGQDRLELFEWRLKEII